MRKYFINQIGMQGTAKLVTLLAALFFVACGVIGIFTVTAPQRERAQFFAAQSVLIRDVLYGEGPGNGRHVHEGFYVNRHADEPFMEAIEKYVTDNINAIKKTKPTQGQFARSSNQRSGKGREPIGKCRRCGNDVTESPKAFGCVGDGCGFVLFKDSKFFALKKKTLTKDILISQIFNYHNP